MTNIIIIYLAIVLIIRVFFKTNKSIISCGLVGFSAVEGLTEIQKFKITQNLKLLALYNQERGEHGCGVYMNGNIIRGYDDIQEKKNTKKISDLMADIDNPFPIYESGSVIIHTRHATHGAHTKANTHPFVIPSVHGEDKDLIIAHNGQIQNILTLCGEHGIKSSDYDVDSHALGALIDKASIKTILTNYKGYAALLWNYPSDPDTLYFFHGATRKVAKEENTWIERPLFYLKTNEGIYFSSLEESLLAIRDNKKQIPVDVACNIVFKAIKGKISKNVIEIDREDANLYTSQPNTAVTKQQAKQGVLYGNTNYNNNNFNFTKDAPSCSLIESETKPSQANDMGRVYFWKGRYWLGSLLIHGEHKINHKGFITNDEVSSYYFWAGVMLKGQNSYQTLQNLLNVKVGWLVNKNENFAHSISLHSEYPVTNFDSEFTSLNNNYWKYGFYKNSHRTTSNFSPKFSNRTYIISNKGFLVNITSSDKEETFSMENKTDIVLTGKALFHKVFANVMEAQNTLTKKHFNALTEFCTELIRINSPIDPISEEVHDYVLSVIRNAVNKKISISDECQDDDNLLETFYEIEEENFTKMTL